MILPKRIWKDIEGFEGLYQVSNLGEVRSLTREITRYDGYTQSYIGKILKQSNHKGYFLVSLCENSIYKHIYVHTLVAQAFLPNPNNYNEINHKDENKHNNCVWNLEWCDRSYNNSYGTYPIMTKLRFGYAVKNITTNETFLSQRDACKKCHIGRNTLKRCCQFNTPDSNGHYWEYIYRRDN